MKTKTKNITLAAALAAAAVGAATVAVSTPANAAEEKCYGIAKAGENHCANLAGTHSCAGQSTEDNDKTEWKGVAEGTCKELGGMTAKEAKAAYDASK